MAEANYVFIKDGSVVNIVVFDNPTQELLDIFIAEHNIDNILPCGDNTKAVMGATYLNGIFIGPKPYTSWILNEITFEWEPPIPYPIFDEENPKYYQWNEDILNWEEIQVSE
jgi:hypothetical protein